MVGLCRRIHRLPEREREVEVTPKSAAPGWWQALTAKHLDSSTELTFKSGGPTTEIQEPSFKSKKVCAAVASAAANELRWIVEVASQGLLASRCDNGAMARQNLVPVPPKYPVHRRLILACMECSHICAFSLSAA